MLQRLNIPFEVKALKEREFEGYGSVFGNVDLGDDVVMPGAFKDSLSRKMPKMLYQHWPDRIAGVWKDAVEDSRGLHMRGRLIDTPIGNQAYVELKEGALDGLSIGFETQAASGRSPRKLERVKLWEVSLVTFPMNESALITSVKRSWSTGLPETVRELEESLREAGMSRSEAKTAIAQLGTIFTNDLSDGMSDGHLRDAGDDAATDLIQSLKNLEHSFVAGIFSK